MSLGCPLFFLRPLVSLVFAIVVFLALSGYLLVNVVDSRVLSADFYAGALSEERVYDRLYDEVLVDPAFEDTAKELLGNVAVPAEDIAAVGRKIMPPFYLQRETERNLEALIDYLKKDTDNLQLYVDMTTPLANANKELVGYALRSIDEAEVVEVGADDLDEFVANALRDLEGGNLPRQAPSLAGIPVQVRLDSYDRAVESLRRDRRIPRWALDALDKPDTDRAIREALSAGDADDDGEDLKEAFKEAGSSLLTSVIDDALDEVRSELVTAEGLPCKGLPEGADLSRCIYYDLLDPVDEHVDVDEELAGVRDGVSGFRILRGWLPLTVSIMALLGLVGVNMPHINSALRWVGIALTTTGLVFLIVSQAAGSAVRAGLDSALQDGLSDAPESMTLISMDVTSRMASDLASALTAPSVTLLGIGLALLIASFFIQRIPIVRRIPFISSLLAF